MDYYKLSIPISGEDIDPEIIIAVLASIGFESFEEQKDFLIAFIPVIEYDKEMLDELPYMSNYLQSDDINIEIVPDKNWNEVWESNYPPVYIGDNCCIRAPFHEHDSRMEYDVIIKPKMAFGTAHHETTEMMLELILKNHFKDKHVLDMGCGSGVLAIMASLKGAERIIAIDIDKWSFENTLENAELNGVNNIEVRLGGAEEIPDEKFNVIFANINKNILLRDMKYYSDSLETEGSIYLSGFYNNDLDDIERSASENGLVSVECIENNKWVAAVFVK